MLILDSDLGKKSTTGTYVSELPSYEALPNIAPEGSTASQSNDTSYPGLPHASTSTLSSGMFPSPYLATGDQYRTPFTRKLPPHLSYSSFAPIFLIAKGRYVDSGFPLLAPPTSVTPHPFVDHDVNESDWFRFLNELNNSTQLNVTQHLSATVLPTVLSLGMAGVISFRGMKERGARELIDRWNHHFFHVRKMEIVLTRGKDAVSGTKGHPLLSLDPNLKSQATFYRQKTKDSTSSSSSSDDEIAGESAQSRKARRQALKAEKRQRKKEKRELKRRNKMEKQEFLNEYKLKKAETKQRKKEMQGDHTYRLFVVAL